MSPKLIVNQAISFLSIYYKKNVNLILMVAALRYKLDDQIIH